MSAVSLVRGFLSLSTYTMKGLGYYTTGMMGSSLLLPLTTRGGVAAVRRSILGSRAGWLNSSHNNRRRIDVDDGTETEQDEKGAPPTPP